jgi:hypothetical protein
MPREPREAGVERLNGAGGRERLLDVERQLEVADHRRRQGAHGVASGAGLPSTRAT